ncbi:hypothetical protein RJZ90_006809 [Blastomyces dermatitidis]
MLPLFDVLEAGKLHLAMIALDRGSYLAQRSNDYLKDSTKRGEWPRFYTMASLRDRQVPAAFGTTELDKEDARARIFLLSESSIGLAGSVHA